MVLVNGIMLQKSKSFVTLGKVQFMIKIKIEGAKYIYIIPAKRSYQYLSATVIGLWDMQSTQW